MGGTCPRSPREAMSEPRLGATQDPNLALQPGLSLHKVGGRWFVTPPPFSAAPRGSRETPGIQGAAGCRGLPARGAQTLCREVWDK